MTHPTQARNALAAAQRLARYEACPEIKPFRADEDMACANCGFAVYPTRASWRHSQNEVRAMRALVVDGEWP